MDHEQEIAIAFTVEQWIELRTFLSIHWNRNADFNPAYYLGKIYDSINESQRIPHTPQM